MQIDVNGNGLVSLAELDKGIRDIIRIPQLFNTKPVLMRAFNAAKAKGKAKNEYSDNYIEKSEYRILLKYIRMYYEYWVAFDLIDIDGDRRVSFKEFKNASPQLTNWGIDMSNPEAEWKKCDADGKGMVLFDEFCNYAIQRSLDLDDDDDVTDSDLEVQQNFRGNKAQERTRKYNQEKKAKRQEPPKKYDIWEQLRIKLPWEKTQEGQDCRIKIWRMIDAGGNGMIKLVELDKGMRDVINLPQLFKTKPVMMKAFIAAKQIVRSQSNYSSDYV